MTLISRWRNLSRRLFFQWRYLGSPTWDTGITPRELNSFIHSHPAGRALDLGCGTGTNAISLAKAGWDVTGVDFITSALATGRKKAHRAHVKVDLRQGDVTHLKNIHGPFDLVLDIGCFHTLDYSGKIAYSQQLVGLLASEGTFLLYGFISPSEEASFGIKPSELDLLARYLECIARSDGEDRRGRPSAWLTYRLKP